ncbi:SufBD protein [bacterium]|nr:SufBD protein [bacterium]
MSESAIATIYEAADLDPGPVHDPDAAHLVVDGNRVLGRNLVAGLTAEVDEQADGVRLVIRLAEATVLERPVHLCFGMSGDSGQQQIDLDVELAPRAGAIFTAHCAFPFARDVEHRMQADIRVGDHATYRYRERHVHGRTGGVLVVPRTRLRLGEGARVTTDFELLRGRVGEVDIDYRSTCGPDSVLEMDARVDGRADDRIAIREVAGLEGERARGVLTSRVAVRDRARAEIHNELTASAAGTSGHVDCKEIVTGEATASAVPIVLVQHPRAHVTHEAAVGSVDHKQLQTLMARGLDEDEAVALIIEGLLS